MKPYILANEGKKPLQKAGSKQQNQWTTPCDKEYARHDRFTFEKQTYAPSRKFYLYSL